MINVFQPELGEDELNAVREVFSSNWVGKGKKTDEFEIQFSNYVGVQRKLIKSISCCTEGLFQAMKLLELGPGAEVILPSISFTGAGNAIADCGATPVFCDVDSRTLNPRANHIDEKITSHTKAIMIIHYGGVPCQMEEILSLTVDKNLYLIEDSACSVASRFKGKACGTFGNVGCWSFDAMKILVAGDGGTLYVNDMDMAEKAERLLYLGLLSKSGFSKTQKVDERWWEYDICCYGRRAIMNDISASIGLVQLKKLPEFIEKRRIVHKRYNDELKDIAWLSIPPEIQKEIQSSFYFYWIQTKAELRDKLANFLRENGIYTTFRYYPLHLVKYYGSNSVLPNSEKAAAETLCIPMHHSLSDDDVTKVIENIYKFGKSI